MLLGEADCGQQGHRGDREGRVPPGFTAAAVLRAGPGGLAAPARGCSGRASHCGKSARCVCVRERERERERVGGRVGNRVRRERE